MIVHINQIPETGLYILPAWSLNLQEINKAWLQVLDYLWVTQVQNVAFQKLETFPCVDRSSAFVHHKYNKNLEPFYVLKNFTCTHKVPVHLHLLSKLDDGEYRC